MEDTGRDQFKFRGHKYRYEHPFTSHNHWWEVRGPQGGVHFHASIMDDATSYPDPSCGMEFHYAISPYGNQRAPDHVNCPITGGRCWYDGISKYANETLWPMIEPMLKSGDHQAIFRVLEGEYERRIEEDLERS